MLRQCPSSVERQTAPIISTRPNQPIDRTSKSWLCRSTVWSALMHCLIQLYTTIIQPHATGSVTMVSSCFIFELVASQPNSKFRKAPILSTTLASSINYSLMNWIWPLRDWPFDLRCELQLNFRTQGARIQRRSHLHLATDPTCGSNGSRPLMNGVHRSHHHLLSQQQANLQTKIQRRARLEKMSQTTKLMFK